jgi:hypothetical protein
MKRLCTILEEVWQMDWFRSWSTNATNVFRAILASSNRDTMLILTLGREKIGAFHTAGRSRRTWQYMMVLHHGRVVNVHFSLPIVLELLYVAHRDSEQPRNGLKWAHGTAWRLTEIHHLGLQLPLLPFELRMEQCQRIVIEFRIFVFTGRRYVLSSLRHSRIVLVLFYALDRLAKERLSCRMSRHERRLAFWRSLVYIYLLSCRTLWS